MAEITVIVPIFKIELYLSRCIDSILAQSFPDFSLVLIDDGSPDKCPMICDAYAERDSRVRVIHQLNVGPAAARNRGIELALKDETCEYLAFIDGDDCVHPQYLEQLYQAVTLENADASMCQHHYISREETVEGKIQISNSVVYSLNAEDLMISQWSSFNYAWGKLFAKKLFSELRYPENISFGEDNLTIYQALFACNQIAFVERKLYYYFYNATGITKSPWTVQSLDVFEGIKEQLAFYKANGYERAYNKEIELYIQQCAYQIHRIRENRKKIKDNVYYIVALKKEMKRLFKENRAYYLWSNLYWAGALYPRVVAILQILARVKNDLKENGLKGTIRKVLKKFR